MIFMHVFCHDDFRIIGSNLLAAPFFTSGTGAAASPACLRSWIKRRSNCASEENVLKISSPEAVVSITSSQIGRKPMPLWPKRSTNCTKCDIDLPKRSNRQISKVSPLAKPLNSDQALDVLIWRQKFYRQISCCLRTGFFKCINLKLHLLILSTYSGISNKSCHLFSISWKLSSYWNFFFKTRISYYFSLSFISDFIFLTNDCLLRHGLLRFFASLTLIFMAIPSDYLLDREHGVEWPMLRN